MSIRLSTNSMRLKIVFDLVFDALISLLLAEGALYGALYVTEEYMRKSDIHRFLDKNYWPLAIGAAIVFIMYFAIQCIVCFRKCKLLEEKHGVSDFDLYDYYSRAEKCCQYRVYGEYIFVNTSHGIICMDKYDVIECKAKSVRHTRKTNYTVRGNVRSTYHSNDYYTYHHTLRTRHGTFKNTVSNHGLLEKLNYLLS